MQLPLALLPPVPVTPAIVRNTDPGTSHAAAREQTSSGRRESHCFLIRAAVLAQPGLTYRELHQALAGRIAEPVEVMRRLSTDLAPLDPATGRELATSEFVRGGDRKCTVSGRPACTWWPRAAAHSEDA